MQKDNYIYQMREKVIIKAISCPGILKRLLVASKKFLTYRLVNKVESHSTSVVPRMGDPDASETTIVLKLFSICLIVENSMIG